MKKLFKSIFWILRSPAARRLICDLADDGRLNGSYRSGNYQETTHCREDDDAYESIGK